jgi:hypothetical protein
VDRDNPFLKFIFIFGEVLPMARSRTSFYGGLTNPLRSVSIDAGGVVGRESYFMITTDARVILAAIENVHETRHLHPTLLHAMVAAVHPELDM